MTMASSVNNLAVIESVRLNIVIADPSKACSHREMLISKYAEELSHRSSPPPWTSNGSLSCFYFFIFPHLSQAQASDSRRTVTAPVCAALQTLPASHGSSSTLSGVEDVSEVELMR